MIGSPLVSSRRLSDRLSRPHASSRPYFVSLRNSGTGTLLS